MSQQQQIAIMPGSIAAVVSGRWPREVVVDHGDGTVSLYSPEIAGTIRARRAGDVVRGERA